MNNRLRQSAWKVAAWRRDKFGDPSQEFELFFNTREEAHPCYAAGEREFPTWHWSLQLCPIDGAQMWTTDFIALREEFPADRRPLTPTEGTV